MDNFFAATSVILGEVSIALTLLCGFLVFNSIRRHRKEKNALLNLTEKILLQEPERLEKLKALLKDRYHVDEGKLEETSSNLLAIEKNYYKALMEIFYKRDVSAMQEITTLFATAIEPYHALERPSGNAVSSETSIDELATTMEQLKQENLKLSAELNNARDDMKRTISEYASAFHVETDDSDQAPQQPQETQDDQSTDDSEQPPETVAEEAIAVDETMDNADAIDEIVSADDAPQETPSGGEDKVPPADEGNDNDLDKALEELELDPDFASGLDVDTTSDLDSEKP